MFRHPHVSLHVPPLLLRRPRGPMAQVPCPWVPCPLDPFGSVPAGCPTLTCFHWQNLLPASLNFTVTEVAPFLVVWWLVGPWSVSFLQTSQSYEEAKQTQYLCVCEHLPPRPFLSFTVLPSVLCCGLHVASYLVFHARSMVF